MKRELRFTTLLKQLFVFGIVLLASTGTMNAEEVYYDFYATLKAYPTGAGKVYAKVDTDAGNIVNDQMGMPFSPDMETPADEVDVKFMAEYIGTGYFNACAVPANGWILAGFSACKKNADEEHLFDDSIFSRSNPASIGVISHASNNDQSVAEGLFPITPDTTFYAIFTHVAVDVCLGQDSLGTAKISKVSNDINDQVTLTAIPRDAKHTEFDYWIKKETGEHIATNPLQLTVSECAHYEAHFSSDLAETINFPEEGGLTIFYSDSLVTVPSNVKVLTFNYSEYSDSVMYNEDKNAFYQVPDTSLYYAYAKEPYVMFGKGEATFFKISDEINEYSTSYFKMAEKDTLVSKLAVTCHYYSVNLEKQQFELLADDATISANTAYWALPNERYQIFGVNDAPAVIYWNDPESTTGIQNISQSTNTKASKAQGIYNLQGQKVGKMTGKGLYIVNGKKVINLAK